MQGWEGPLGVVKDDGLRPPVGKCDTLRMERPDSKDPQLTLEDVEVY